MELVLRRLVVLVILAVSSTPAEARQEWTCRRGKIERRITIEAKEYGKAPCKVFYKKPSERKPDKEIGHALRQFAFCEDKAEEVALRLQNMNWECARKDS